MRSKTIYSEQYVDCEYDVSFEDIMELIESCDEDELKEIRDIVGDKNNIIERSAITNLDDEQKYELLSAAMKKYSYQELLDRLDIKPYEIF